MSPYFFESLKLPFFSPFHITFDQPSQEKDILRKEVICEMIAEPEVFFNTNSGSFVALRFLGDFCSTFFLKFFFIFYGFLLKMFILINCRSEKFLLFSRLRSIIFSGYFFFFSYLCYMYLQLYCIWSCQVSILQSRVLGLNMHPNLSLRSPLSPMLWSCFLFLKF